MNVTPSKKDFETCECATTDRKRTLNLKGRKGGLSGHRPGNTLYAAAAAALSVSVCD